MIFGPSVCCCVHKCKLKVDRAGQPVRFFKCTRRRRRFKIDLLNLVNDLLKVSLVVTQQAGKRKGCPRRLSFRMLCKQLLTYVSVRKRGGLCNNRARTR